MMYIPDMMSWQLQHLKKKALLESPVEPFGAFYPEDDAIGKRCSVRQRAVGGRKRSAGGDHLEDARSALPPNGVSAVAG